MRMLAGVLLALVVLGSTAAADKKTAMAANVAGMKQYQKKKYWEAKELFEKAIAEDPTLAYAHYNLAPMASLLENLPLVIRELEWCAASKDPIAAKLLAKAKTDKDLEKASMHPRVREIVGLPKLDTMTTEAILFERSGVWGADGGSCAAPAITLTFKKGGRFAVRLAAGCNDMTENLKDTGTWSIKDDALTLTPRGNDIFTAPVKVAVAECSAGDKTLGWCLALELNGNEYAFERGTADLD